MELELRLAGIEKQLSNLHSLYVETRKWQEILEPWLLRTFNMNMTKLMGRAKIKSYRKFLYRKSPRKAIIPLSGLPSRLSTREKLEGAIFQDSRTGLEKKNSTSEPLQLRIRSVNSFNKSTMSSVDKASEFDGSLNKNAHSSSSSHVRTSHVEVPNVSRSAASRTTETELARTEKFVHFPSETSGNEEQVEGDVLSDVKIEYNISVSDDEIGGAEVGSQHYDSHDFSSDNGFKPTQHNAHSQWVEENTDVVNTNPRTRVELPSHEQGHRIGKLPLILNGTYFKVVATSDFGKRISAQCMKCKTSKIINGAARSSSNFLTHLKRLHKEDFQSFWNEKLKTTSPRIPVPENFYPNHNISNSNEPASPLPPAAPNPRYVSSSWPHNNNFDSLQS